MRLQATAATPGSYNGQLYQKGKPIGAQEGGETIIFEDQLSCVSKIFIVPRPHNDTSKRYSTRESVMQSLNISERTVTYSRWSNEIDKLSHLENNWDSYEAPKPKPMALDTAKLLLKTITLIKFLPTKILPSAEGGISFIFIKENKYANIECDNDGDIIAGTSDRQGNRDIWEIPKEEEFHRHSLEKIQSFLYS